MSRPGITLSRHIIEDEHRHHNTTGELSRLLVQVGYAGKLLSREINRAALVGMLGLVGEINATGDSQKKLDVYSNKIMEEAFAETKLVAGMLSEEMEEVRTIGTGSTAKYLLYTDPLDGSSNTDVNGAMGTIFTIYRRQREGKGDLTAEILSGECSQEVAGYILYGTSTMLVYTCGHGVNGFTLDREVGEFLLSHHNIRCPQRGHSYSANIGRFYEWPKGSRKFVDLVETEDAASGRPYSLRYSGALVADLHRTLLEGGIYFYPPDHKHPQGKLRLFYECLPLARVVEDAGGKASTGSQRIQEVKPGSIHQQVPFVVGSADDVAEYERYSRENAAKVS